MKLKKPHIDVFDNWVKIGKDDGLEKNHASAVAKMVEYSTGSLEQFITRVYIITENLSLIHI